MNLFSSADILSWINPDLLFKSVIVYLLVVWFCIVVWVVRDITNRTSSIIFQVLSILMVLFLTPLGIFVYLLLRPQKTLFEKVFEDEFMRLDAEYNLPGGMANKENLLPEKTRRVMDISPKK